MRLKRKKLLPSMDLREGWKEKVLAQATEAEEGGEEEETPLLRKGKKMIAPRKRSRPTPGSTSIPKKTKIYYSRLQNSLLLLFLTPLSICTKFVSYWSL